MCGTTEIDSGGGFGICDGAGGGSSFSNHLASITVYETRLRLACAGEGCSDSSCDIWISIWLE
jgi:hypothetical protein